MLRFCDVLVNADSHVSGEGDAGDKVSDENVLLVDQVHIEEVREGFDIKNSEIEVKLFKSMDGTKVLTGILAGLENGEILLETPEGIRRIPRKAAALVKPVVDMEGIEEVDLSEDPETENTESGETKDEI